MIPSFLTFSSPAVQEICNHLWQSTVFGLAVALLVLALRRYPARARYWLWMAASAKFLIPFSILIAAGSHLARPTQATLAQTSAYIAIDELSQPFTGASDLQTIPVAPLPTATHPTLTPVTVFTALWLCGLLIVFSRWLIQWRNLTVTIRNATPLCEGRVVETLHRIERIAGIPGPIQLLSSACSMEPGVFGVFRPVLLWPEAISLHLDDSQLEAVLAHEAVHIRRRDNLTSLLHMVVEAIFWFHPLVWWMESQLVKERERACDEEVLLLCHHPQAYAESILKVCELCIESPLTCVSGITGADLKKRIVQIMTDRVARKLNLGRKLLLLAVAAAVVAGPLALGLAHSPLALGQILHSDGPLPSFEVATVRSFKASAGPPPLPGKGAPRRPKQASAGADFHLTAPVKFLIGSAYNIPMSVLDAKVLGGPGWIDVDSYEVHGKIDNNTRVAMAKMPREQSHRQLQLMQQALLADRFKLKVHFEKRMMPEYALVVAKGGPKLTPVKALPEDTVNPPISSPGWRVGDFKKGMLFLPKGRGMEITAKSVTMDELVEEPLFADNLGGRVVVNQTGLSGTYDFTLWFGEEESATSGGEDGTDDAPLRTALQQQLGLKLVSTKGPVEVLVIDHVERPVSQEEAGFSESGSIQASPLQPTAPVLVHSVEPEFTERARRAHASGVVLVNLWVDEEGNPKQVRTQRGLGMGLDQKAIEAVKQYRFTPAMNDGKPVPAQMTVGVKFQVF